MSYTKKWIINFGRKVNITMYILNYFISAGLANSCNDLYLTKGLTPSNNFFSDIQFYQNTEW